MAKPIKLAIEILKRSFPDIDGIHPGEDWGAGENSIHLGDCAEGGLIDDFPACDYYAFESDPNEEIYVLGVHKKLAAKLNELGYFAECWDPGTYIAYQI